MVVQGSLGESVYTVGSAVFPVLNVNEDDVREVFREKGRTIRVTRSAIKSLKRLTKIAKFKMSELKSVFPGVHGGEIRSVRKSITSLLRGL